MLWLSKAPYVIKYEHILIYVGDTRQIYTKFRNVPLLESSHKVLQCMHNKKDYTLSYKDISNLEIVGWSNIVICARCVWILGILRHVTSPPLWKELHHGKAQERTTMASLVMQTSLCYVKRLPDMLYVKGILFPKLKVVDDTFKPVIVIMNTQCMSIVLTKLLTLY